MGFYQTVRQAGQDISNNTYLKDFKEKTYSHNYNYATTNAYEVATKNGTELLDRQYKAGFELQKGTPYTCTQEEPLYKTQTAQAENVSLNLYKKDAKELQKTHKLDSEAIELKRQMEVANINSEKKYRDSKAGKGLVDACNTPAYQAIKDASGEDGRY